MSFFFYCLECMYSFECVQNVILLNVCIAHFLLCAYYSWQCAWPLFLTLCILSLFLKCLYYMYPFSWMCVHILFICWLCCYLFSLSITFVSVSVVWSDHFLYFVHIVSLLMLNWFDLFLECMNMVFDCVNGPYSRLSHNVSFRLCFCPFSRLCAYCLYILMVGTNPRFILCAYFIVLYKVKMCFSKSYHCSWHP